MSEEYREYVRWKMRQQRIVPNKVRHGKWVEVEGYEGILYRCSVCEDKRYKHTTVKYPYCPYCGASMMDEVEG